MTAIAAALVNDATEAEDRLILEYLAAEGGPTDLR